jgi:hypothetical protein
MKDDPKKTGHDRKLISLEEPREIRSWTESLGCSEEELRVAVAAAGHSAAAVKDFLAMKARSGSTSERSSAND